MIRRTSNKFALAAAAVFVLLPALSLTVNNVRAERCAEVMKPVIQRITDNDIYVGIFSKCLPKARWHIRRIGCNHFICHFYCHVPYFPTQFYPRGHDVLEEA